MLNLFLVICLASCFPPSFSLFWFVKRNLHDLKMKAEISPLLPILGLTRRIWIRKIPASDIGWKKDMQYRSRGGSNVCLERVIILPMLSYLVLMQIFLAELLLLWPVPCIKWIASGRGSAWWMTLSSQQNAIPLCTFISYLHLKNLILYFLSGHISISVFPFFWEGIITLKVLFKSNDIIFFFFFFFFSSPSLIGHIEQYVQPELCIYSRENKQANKNPQKNGTDVMAADLGNNYLQQLLLKP